MVQELVHDPILLGRKSLPPTAEDLPAARDLMDTLLHHRESCVGMAANMIGVHKRIIAVHTGIAQMAMLNPKIVKKDGVYEAEEGCLSLAGVRKAKRYQRIEVEYQDLTMKKQRRSFSGFTAQIIQHEIDHCDGILI